MHSTLTWAFLLMAIFIGVDCYREKYSDRDRRFHRHHYPEDYEERRNVDRYEPEYHSRHHYRYRALRSYRHKHRQRYLRRQERPEHREPHRRTHRSAAQQRRSLRQHHAAKSKRSKHQRHRGLKTFHKQAAPKKKGRTLDYPNLKGEDYINPYKKAPEKIDNYEDLVLDYFTRPMLGGAQQMQHGLFLQDKNFTLYVNHLSQIGQLNYAYKDFTKIDDNYFTGSSDYIGDPFIPDEDAVIEMNYEQYFSHIQTQKYNDQQDQIGVDEFFRRQTDEQLMLNFRDFRESIYDSVMRMENVIYGEQETIAEKLQEKDNAFMQLQAEKGLVGMAQTLGKPYYVSLANPDDYFT